MGRQGPSETATVGALVSVIIPVFNGARFLAQALRSAEDQSYRPIEVLVVDDGSTDDSADVARSFSRVRYQRQEHRGPAAARNVGIRLAEGEWIAFLDADDVWQPNKISRQLTWLGDRPGFEGATAFFRNFLEQGFERPPWLPAEGLFKDQRGGFSNLVVRRTIFDRVGMFDENIGYGAIADWLLHVREAGLQFGTVEETLSHRRIHDANISWDAQRRRDVLLRSVHASILRRRGLRT